MIRALRALIGMALGLVAVVAPAWGLFHLVRQGSCGDVGTPACPDAVGGWIVAIVLSATIVAPLAVVIAGRDRRGRVWLLGPLLALFLVGLMAAVAVSFTGASSDPDTHWVGYLVIGLGAVIGLPLLRGIVRGARMAAPPPPAPPKPPVRPAASANPQMAVLAGQLQQIAQAAKRAPSDVLAERLRRLDELKQGGLITGDEHARRRQAILDEV